MTALNAVCDDHGHEDGLPSRELRRHVLAAAIREVERHLAADGYPVPERSLEILHVALEYALEDDDQGQLPAERSH